MIITFDIVTKWDQNDLGNMTYRKTLDYIDEFQSRQKAVIEDLLEEGILDIEGYILNEHSFQTEEWGTVTCVHGMIWRNNKCSES